MVTHELFLFYFLHNLRQWEILSISNVDGIIVTSFFFYCKLIISLITFYMLYFILPNTIFLSELTLQLVLQEHA